MSWLRNLQGQLSELAQEVLSEATEEVQDPETELQVAKKKCAEAERILAIEQAKANSLDEKVKNLETQLYESNVQMDEISAKYESMVRTRDDEIKKLQIQMEQMNEAGWNEPHLDDDFDLNAQQIADLQREVAHWKSLAGAANSPANQWDMLHKSELDRRLEEFRQKKEAELAAVVEQHAESMAELREMYEDRILSLQQYPASSSTSNADVLDAVMLEKEELLDTKKKLEDMVRSKNSGSSGSDSEKEKPVMVELFENRDELIERLRSAEAELERLREEKADVEATTRETENLREQNHELTAAYNDLERDFEDYKEQTQNTLLSNVDLQNRINGLRANLVEYEERYELCKRENVEVLAQLARLNEDFERLRQNVASVQARRSGCDSLGEEVEKLRAALDESVSDREQLRTDVQHFREAVADIDSEMDTLRSTRANLTDENRAMAENLQRYETTMKDIISSSEKDIEEVRKQFAFLQTRHESERESFAKENSALRDEIDSLHRQNELLREESKLIAELNAQLKSREEIETRREHLYMEKLSVMENLLQESNGEIGALQSELGEYKIAYENLKDQFSGVRRQVAYCDESKEKGDLKQQISDLLEKSEEQPTNDEETFHELSQLVAEKQTEVDSLRQKLARLEDGVVRELSTDHERESATTSHRNLDLQAQIENLQEAIGDLKAELERQSLGRKSAEDDVDRQRLQIDAKQKIIEELEMQIEEIRVTKSSKEDESYRIDDVTLRQLFLSLFTGMGCGRSPCRISQMALAAPDEKLHDLVLSFIRASSANEITRVCDLSSIPAQAKNEAISECNKGSHERAATILVEAAQQKLRESTRELSGAGGKRMLKSDHGTYIRAYDREWKVDLKRGMAWSWEHWYVEDWGCKVVFKAIHSPGRFMRALPNGNVDLVPTNPKECPASMWKPFNNSDGTWSFLSIHGTWLSGLRNGIVCCQWECNSSEKFTLPSW